MGGQMFGEAEPKQPTILDRLLQLENNQKDTNRFLKASAAEGGKISQTVKSLEGKVKTLEERLAALENKPESTPRKKYHTSEHKGYGALTAALMILERGVGASFLSKNCATSAMMLSRLAIQAGLITAELSTSPKGKSRPEYTVTSKGVGKIGGVSSSVNVSARNNAIAEACLSYEGLKVPGKLYYTDAGIDYLMEYIRKIEALTEAAE